MGLDEVFYRSEVFGGSNERLRNAIEFVFDGKLKVGAVFFSESLKVQVCIWNIDSFARAQEAVNKGLYLEAILFDIPDFEDEFAIIDIKISAGCDAFKRAFVIEGDLGIVADDVGLCEKEGAFLFYEDGSFEGANADSVTGQVLHYFYGPFHFPVKLSDDLYTLEVFGM